MKRLDLMVASVFGVSRSQALDLIKQGQVYVNHQVIKKASY
ncbi:MAG: hypothetical protein GX845_05875 [Erysipelothrix sp.]|jgi:RNA-binding protein YlmH|nr:hypothetical protein [Erysipelothrix sp.]